MPCHFKGVLCHRLLLCMWNIRVCFARNNEHAILDVHAAVPCMQLAPRFQQGRATGTAPSQQASSLRQPSVSPWHFASQGRRQPQRGVRRLLPGNDGLSNMPHQVVEHGEMTPVQPVLNNDQCWKAKVCGTCTMISLVHNFAHRRLSSPTSRACSLRGSSTSVPKRQGAMLPTSSSLISIQLRSLRQTRGRLQRIMWMQWQVHGVIVHAVICSTAAAGWQ
jgi:hypothetical protein